MDIEAHSLTLTAIIIGIGMTEMFGNLHRLIRHRERVRWDLLPLAWGVTCLFLILNYWWALYLHLDGSQQAHTAAEFGLILAPSVLLFLIAASVLPHFGETAEWDMRAHYAAQRKVFILTFALYQVSTWTTALLTGALAWNYVTVIRFAILALLLSMLAINSRRWDWIGVVIIGAALFARLVTQVVR
jgi:hypothetical protein